MDVVDKYVILVVSGDMIIGEVQEKEGKKGLKNPKLLYQVTNGQQIGVKAMDMVGSPRWVPIPKGALWYFLEDKSIIDMYIRITTGLVIPTTGRIK